MHYLPKDTKDIGEYVITRRTLGSGSFATVYEGHHKRTLEKVAVKSINRDRLNRKLLENLELEIEILRALNHPNIVRLLYVHRSAKHIYLVLEFCEGGDLNKYVRRHGPLKEQSALRFLHDVAQALFLLRSRDLVHRDLKPHNLLLSRADDEAHTVLKLTDFGFARYMVADSMAETICGSPLYMAPEILGMKPYEASADLWSIGAILFEMLFGKPPFTGANHLDLLKNIEASTAVPFPSTVDELGVSSQTKFLLTGLLQKNPAQRMTYAEFFAYPSVGLDVQQAHAFVEKSLMSVDVALLDKQRILSGSHPDSGTGTRAAGEQADSVAPAARPTTEETSQRSAASNSKVPISDGGAPRPAEGQLAALAVHRAFAGGTQDPVMPETPSALGQDGKPHPSSGGPFKHDPRANPPPVLPGGGVAGPTATDDMEAADPLRFAPPEQGPVAGKTGNSACADPATVFDFRLIALNTTDPTLLEVALQAESLARVAWVLCDGRMQLGEAEAFVQSSCHPSSSSASSSGGPPERYAYGGGSNPSVGRAILCLIALQELFAASRLVKSLPSPQQQSPRGRCLVGILQQLYASCMDRARSLSGDPKPVEMEAVVFQHALDLGNEAAVEERLDNFVGSVVLYRESCILLQRLVQVIRERAANGDVARGEAKAEDLTAVGAQLEKLLSVVSARLKRARSCCTAGNSSGTKPF